MLSLIMSPGILQLLGTGRACARALLSSMQTSQHVTTLMQSSRCFSAQDASSSGKSEDAPIAHAPHDSMQSSSGAAPRPAMQLPEAVSGTATSIRTFKDVFDSSLNPSPGDSRDDLFDAGPALGTADTAAPQLQAPDTHRELRAGDKMISQDFGYVAISGHVPKGDTMGLLAAHPRLHPRKTFQPGMAYEPEDLNPFSPVDKDKARSKQRQGVARTLPSEQEVQQYLDFRNVQFLERFLSPAGRLLPRKVTRLPPAIHARVMREIKLARSMGFIAGETLLHKAHLRRVREAEARAYAGRDSSSV